MTLAVKDWEAEKRLLMEREKPLAIELFAGLHGWGEGFVAEGYRVIAFDIVDMVTELGLNRPHPDIQLVLQDVLTLHGSQFRDAAVIVASPPCQEYSYMAMPWSRAKQIAAGLRGLGDFPERYRGSRTVEQLNALFGACFRIQREASEAAGRHIPLIVENVKGAQPWVGRAAWSFGSYYLWGDIPALMPSARKLQKIPMYSDPRRNSGKGARLTSPIENQFRACICPDACDCQNPEPDGDLSKAGAVAHCSMNCPIHNLRPDPVPGCIASVHKNGVWVESQKVPGFNFHQHEKTGKPDGSFQSAAVKEHGRQNIDGGGTKVSGDWFGAYADQKSAGTISPGRLYGKNSHKRKAASAQIAKIPFALANHIARVFDPRNGKMMASG